MNRRFYSVMTALACMAMALPSCDDSNSNGEKPEPSIDPVEEAVPTPISWSEDYATAPDAELGVALTLEEAQANNIVFTCQPGESALAYRLDVFPVSVLYNSLYEAFKARIHGGEKIPEAEVMEQIMAFLFSQEGNGGYVISAKQVAEAGGDYASMTFDWANSQFNQIRFVPNSEYVVVAIGCTDNDGNNGSWESMSVLRVKTPEVPLIGEPKASIEVVPSFNSFKVQIHPNADAKTFTMSINDTYQFDEFEQYYGAAQLKDFIRNFMSAPYDATLDESELRYTFPVANATPDKSFTVITVAADENGVPGEMLRRDFTLLEIPENTSEAGVVMTLDNVSATAVRFKIEMDKNTNLAAFTIVSKAEYESLNLADSATMAVLGRNIIDTGWAAKNPNFRDSLGCEVYEGYYEVDIIKPETELVALYAGRNAYTEVSEVKALPFTTKALVKNNAAAATATIDLTFSSVTRTSFHCDFAVENTSVLYFQYLMTDELFVGGELDQAAATEYLLSKDGNQVPVWMEHSYPYAGMDPAKEYVFIYMAQGWDGVLTEVKSAAVSTLPVEGGKNPTMALNGFIDAQNYFNCEFNIVTDVVKYYCCIIPDEYTRTGIYTPQECIDAWTEDMLSEATNYNSVRYSAPVAGRKRLVALCLPIGEDPETKEEVTGDLAMLFWDEAEYKKDIAVDPNDVRAGVMTADEIFGTAAASYSANARPAQPVKIGAVQAAALRNAIMRNQMNRAERINIQVK